jgi:hypothetical protein
VTTLASSSLLRASSTVSPPPATGGIVGIAEEYPYNYWVPEVIEGYTDRVEGSVALIRQHIQTLPSHIDLLGFDLMDGFHT